jgi:hypothetical protein
VLSAIGVTRRMRVDRSTFLFAATAMYATTPSIGPK